MWIIIIWPVPFRLVTLWKPECWTWVWVSWGHPYALSTLQVWVGRLGYGILGHPGLFMDDLWQEFLVFLGSWRPTDYIVFFRYFGVTFQVSLKEWLSFGYIFFLKKAPGVSTGYFFGYFFSWKKTPGKSKQPHGGISQELVTTSPKTPHHLGRFHQLPSSVKNMTRP